MKLHALYQRTPLARWTNMLSFAARGVRLHPSVRIYGRADALEIGEGSKIGGGCVFNLGDAGRIRLGERLWTYRDVEFHTEHEIEVGAGSSFQRGVLVNGNVAIGRGCIFAPGVFVSSGKHVFDLNPSWPIRAQEAFLANAPDDPAAVGYVLDRPVRIDEDCWLGAHVVVAPGVRVGRGAIVGANSVVTRDVAPYAIVAGAPARQIKQRLEWRAPPTLDATRAAARPYLYSGFEIEESGQTLTATAVGEASVALGGAADGPFEIALSADVPGALSALGARQTFERGETVLRFAAPGATAQFADATIVPLRFAVAKRARIRVTRCGFGAPR
jgi:acetyltransferase-like isoleucine patch superfamily enzyme